MQELLARGQMVSAGGRKPRPSEAKENAELEGRRGGGGRLGCCHGASKTGRVGRLCSQGRLERGMMGWGPGELLPLSSFFTGDGGGLSLSISLCRPPTHTHRLLAVGQLLSLVPRGYPFLWGLLGNWSLLQARNKPPSLGLETPNTVLGQG